MKRDWLPLPFPEHMIGVLGVGLFAEAIGEAFKSTGEALLTQIKAEGLLHDGDRVLELGCACGRFARVLVDERIGSYIGIDSSPEMIGWCKQEILPRDSRFAFQLIEGGPEQVQHMLEPDSIDFALLESWFDNMPLEVAAEYLRELGKVMVPGGRVATSVFFAVGKTYADPAHHYYEMKPWWGLVEEAGFDHAMRGIPGTGETRNWCLLTRRED